MKRFLVLASVAASALLAASAAHAGRDQWSIGIDLAPVATYVSGGPAYDPAPVGYAPRRQYQPYPVYAEPVYAPVYSQPVYAAPRPIYTPRHPHLWLPPLPPLPRLPPLPWLSHHHHDRGHDGDRRRYDDRGPGDDRGGHRDRIDFRR